MFYSGKNSKISNNIYKTGLPKFFMFACAFAIACVVFSSIALAITIEKSIESPQLESRAQNIFREIKCLVCEGQAIHDSDSEFARSMRSVIREQIELGKTDEQVFQLIDERYGDDVFLKPAFKEDTIFIWIAPFLIIAAGLLILLKLIKRQEYQI
jgi:cytochrome c-type biogenesis protein CcmH